MSPFKALTVSLARTNLRDPATMLFSYAFPPALLVVLALTMGDQPGVDGHDIVDFISPNVMGFGVAFVGMFAGATTIGEWREKGVGRVLRSAPMPVSSILASALAVAVVSALVQAVLIVLTGFVPTVGVTLSPWAILTVVPVFLGTLLFYSLGMLFGLVLPTVTAVSLAVMIVVLPMGFASGALLPLEILPGWTQTLANFLPLTYLLDALRWPLTGVAELSDALIGIGVTGVVGAALFWAATKLMRWT
ncbi:ABC transporter permease [Actinomyces sp. 594]|uniref:ABC transporter permease n=1 Tax=Actinomyces sp. 594 TaxID=2057793 RepID=UPI001C591879|nr:ABC transporter permease [Actinomyces sp. 594]MBW3068354.1 ABC transporter permease [Actinomyces sp. 594]